VGEDALERGLDGAVEAVVGDEIAIAVGAGFLEPAERAEQFVVAAPQRHVVADAAGLVLDLAGHLCEEGVGGGVEVTGEANYSRSTPGVSYEYPEFEGFFAAWDWLELRTRGGNVVILNKGNIPYFGLYSPTRGEKPVLELPDLGWSFLHAVPPIGTKFALPVVQGPQSQPAQFTGFIEGELGLSVPR
jgi:hypothetical protein